MLDLTKLKTGSFDVKLPDGTELHMNPPKIKSLRKIMAAAKSENAEEMLDAVTLILSGNATGKKISREKLEDMLDMTDVYLILNDYFKWVNSISNLPN